MAIVTGAEAGLEAARRGATIIQLRDPAATVRRLEEEATRLVRESPLPVVVSSRLDLALASQAAGVHLPEEDIPVATARRLLGASRLLGRSVHSLEPARRAAEEGADYLVFGPVFATGSHPGREPTGLQALRDLARAVPIPVLAIGGVDAARAEACRMAGAAGFAAIGYFQQR
jgi:thiamine-phosphate pyrophosphorylase